jgi:hypothetical protein
VARITTLELWTKQRNPEGKKFFAGNGISQFVDSESPLSIGLQNCTMAKKVQTGLHPEV